MYEKLTIHNYNYKFLTADNFQINFYRFIYYNLDLCNTFKIISYKI